MARLQQQDTLSCPSLELLVQHVAHSERLSYPERRLITDHIAQCPYCSNIYSVLCDMDQEFLAEVHKVTDKELANIVVTRHSLEDSMDNFWRRVDADGDNTGRCGHKAMAVRIGGAVAAACILIVVCYSWMILWNSGCESHRPGVAGHSPESAFVYAEFVTVEGRKPLALNQPVVSGDQPREILLGGMHRVVMNRNTRAVFSVEPQRAEGAYLGKTPYAIRLDQGELYVEVVPGNPFAVNTDNARLDITGTIFNVVANGDTTSLTLLKGSVRFSSLFHSQEAVSVTAGHISSIIGHGLPLTPVLTDTVLATAWARQNGTSSTELAANDNLDAGGYLTSGYSCWSSRPDRDTLGYAVWRDTHAAPHMAYAKLADILTARGIETDWIELMMISGDIWQFRYDPDLSEYQPLIKMEPAAVTRLARWYGQDDRIVMSAMGIADHDFINLNNISGQQISGLLYAEALQRWRESLITVEGCTQEDNMELKVFSLRAGQYLSTTRTAAYLWARAYPEKVRRLLAEDAYISIIPICSESQLAALEPDEWIDRLRRQALAAQNCNPVAMEWLFAPIATDFTRLELEQNHILFDLLGEILSPSPK